MLKAMTDFIKDLALLISGLGALAVACSRLAALLWRRPARSRPKKLIAFRDFLRTSEKRVQGLWGDHVPSRVCAGRDHIARTMEKFLGIDPDQAEKAIDEGVSLAETVTGLPSPFAASISKAARRGGMRSSLKSERELQSLFYLVFFHSLMMEAQKHLADNDDAEGGCSTVYISISDALDRRRASLARSIEDHFTDPTDQSYVNEAKSCLRKILRRTARMEAKRAETHIEKALRRTQRWKDKLVRSNVSRDLIASMFVYRLRDFLLTSIEDEAAKSAAA